MTVGKNSAPLVVDFDQTLVRGDSLQESILFAVRKDWKNLFRALIFLTRGRIALKSFASSFAGEVVDKIPANERVLVLIEEARKSGRPVILATASHARVAEIAAARFGPFDEVISSSDAVNLKGHAKAIELVNRYGDGGFDYVGDSLADRAIFERAKTALIVSPNADQEITELGNGERIRRRNHLPWRARVWFRAARPHQWVKNFLVFVPVLAAGTLNFDSTVALALAFVSLSAVASSLYIFNDLLDIWHDRSHPDKKKRPLASGDLSIAEGVAITAFGLLLGALLGVFLGELFMSVLLGYAVLSISYSTFLKKLILVDAFVLAALYVIRLVAGSIVAQVPLSGWLLVFSMFVFLSLGLAKRYVEIDGSEEHGATSIRGRGYTYLDRSFVGIAGISLSVVSGALLALYVADQTQVESQLVNVTLLWLVVPLWLFWVLRLWILAERRQLHSDPILFAVRDKLSIVVGLAGVALFAVRM